MQQFYIGLKHFINASCFMAKHKLLHYYLYPLLLSVLFYMSVTAFTIQFAESVTRHLVYKQVPMPEINAQSMPSFLSFFNGQFIQNITTILVGLVVLYIASKISKYLVLIILSPLFAYLSERVEEKITGQSYPFNFPQFVKDIIRGVRIALRNLLIEFLMIGLFTIASFFAGPFAILIMPFLWLVSAYFYGFSMIDYTCERKKMSIRQSVEFVRAHKQLAICIGSLYSILDLIPLLGLMVAPINAVVGTTTAIIEIEKNSQLSLPKHPRLF